MSQAVLFELGAVIFVAVSTAVFLYGLALFREWQNRDDTEARAVSAAPDGVVELAAQVQQFPSDTTADSRSSAA